MWVEIKKVEGFKEAEKWKNLFEDEGVPTRILPASSEAAPRKSDTYLVLVPGDKEHIIEEVLRRL